MTLKIKVYKCRSCDALVGKREEFVGGDCPHCGTSTMQRVEGIIGVDDG